MIKNNILLLLFYLLLGVIISPIEFFIAINWPNNIVAFIVFSSLNLIAYYLFSERFMIKQDTNLKNINSLSLPLILAVIVLITKQYYEVWYWYFAQFILLSKLPISSFDSMVTVISYFILSMAMVFINLMYRERIKTQNMIYYIFIANAGISILLNVLFRNYLL